MRILLTKEGAEALRTLATEIPNTIDNIVYSTEHLLSVYQTVSDELGVHELGFYDMVFSVKQAQEISTEAIAAVPALLLTTADKIDDYINLHQTYQDISPAGEGYGSKIHENVTSSGEKQIGQRTVFEIVTLKNTLELTDGDPTVLQAGGLYRDIKKSVDSKLYEVHHIPPQSVFDEKFASLPAIAMLKEDHAGTSSFRGRMGRTYTTYFPSGVSDSQYKQEITDLINRGMLAEAIRNEIYEIRNEFGCVKNYAQIGLQVSGLNEVSQQ
jgi:hypothetical protein